MKALNRALRALVCGTLIGLSVGVHAETVDLTRYLLRLDADFTGLRQDAFASAPGTGVLAIEGTADVMTVSLNGQIVQPG